MSLQTTRFSNSIVATALKIFGGLFFLLAALTAFDPDYPLAGTCPPMAIGGLLFALPYTGLFDRFMATAGAERTGSTGKTVRAKKPMKKVPGSRAPGREKRMQRRKEERQGRA
ncbi:hypothetical protein LTR91_001096 [Friedmanniomyces endolithicus]|uniref:Uncharacterized protein n=1 Tax=Friedmanniomyces endolithicus TaxID=329885 RepID=A0A4U0V9T3_9PEZI|nr:hypothetical protein LTS09_011765 [Friedmanniomyces endolithicus]KAK0268823.1 hypothetical protein LTR35_015245 [Friedmanniomyces endolithicus]KAK0299985.1 hypothetical protein LTS00_001755 [Friedmanniomyces endolithicus]KAK0307567.1 hypothetical protein LTR01_005567 [Friedmanniomyces endolithicus]KAK0321177.1 hypothetical protein LTR82_007629 [Friedmanniomyces endolithicus]